jgi:hypothetical protein
MKALWVLLAGCGVSENHFWKERADIWCDKEKKCDGEGFDDQFDGKGDCKDWWLKENDATRTSYEEDEDCEYDGGAAAECLRGYRHQNCEEIGEGQIPEGCNEVYSCLDP